MLMLIKTSPVYLMEAEAVVSETSLKEGKLSGNLVGTRDKRARKLNIVREENESHGRD